MNWKSKQNLKKRNKDSYELEFSFIDTETKKIISIVSVVFGVNMASYNVRGQELDSAAERHVSRMVGKYQQLIKFISYYEESGLDNIEIKEAKSREDKSFFGKRFIRENKEPQKILGELNIFFHFNDFKMDFRLDVLFLENKEEVNLLCIENLGIYLTDLDESEFPFYREIMNYPLKKQRVRKLMFAQKFQ